MKSATLSPKEDRRLLRGHLWAYRNEFQQLPTLEDGALVDVFTASGRFVGRGFYQADGGIAVRLLSRRQEEIGQDFFAQRIAQARSFRERLFPGSDTWRWIHAESDGFPGLVADRYGALVVLKTSCAFYAQSADVIAGALLAEPGVSGVVLNAGERVQTYGSVPEEVSVSLGDVALSVNVRSAQKTGLFLDQRLNAEGIRPFCPGARVLDGHCYAGAWSCTAARAGAAAVLGVDTSAAAIDAARANARRNNAEGVCRFECAPVEEVLACGEGYDVVILDPPAFAKTRGSCAKALARYHALNAAAMRAVLPGGVLVTCSCSHFIDPAGFTEMLKRAATAARRKALLLDLRGAAPDHPVLMAMPETAYLKCATVRLL